MNNVIKHKMIYYDIEIFHLALNIIFDEVICTFCMWMEECLVKFQRKLNINLNKECYKDKSKVVLYIPA